MSSTDSSSMVAREGREHQLYSESGARIVAGTVIVNSDKNMVLLVSSFAHPNKWVLPKGGAEKDETLEQSALRETWEEAGAIGTIGEFLGAFKDPQDTKAEYHFFELKLQKLAEDWPEAHKRRRHWMTYAEAHHALIDNNRLPLAAALEASSVTR